MRLDVLFEKLIQMIEIFLFISLLPHPTRLQQ